jgi:hypothetical protein
MLRSLKLFSEFEFVQKLRVAGFVLGLKIIQEAAALSDEFKKAKARCVILGVLLKVRVQSIDAIGDQCDLYFSGSGVRAFGAEGLDQVGLFGLDFGFASFAHLHVSVFLKNSSTSFEYSMGFYLF